MNKRIGRPTITDHNVNDHAALPSYTLEEALDLVMKVKRARNLKERTFSGYVMNMRYCIEWITERYDVLPINDVTVAIIRDYILWCSDEKEFYGGHPYKSEFDKERRGISVASVNVRIRVLKTFFAVLHAVEVIDRNPALNVSLMRQDIDTVMPLTEDELQRLIKASDQRQWVQWRDYIIMITILDTGARLGEICSLEKAEVDFVKKQQRLDGPPDRKSIRNSWGTHVYA